MAKTLSIGYVKFVREVHKVSKKDLFFIWGKDRSLVLDVKGELLKIWRDQFTVSVDNHDLTGKSVTGIEGLLGDDDLISDLKVLVLDNLQEVDLKGRHQMLGTERGTGRKLIVMSEVKNDLVSLLMDVSVKCVPPGVDNKLFREYIEMVTSSHGKTVTDEGIELLKQEYGSMFFLLREELHKICLYVGDREQVREEDIRECGRDVEGSRAFALVSALLGGRKRESLALMQVLARDQGTSAVIGALARNLGIIQNLSDMSNRREDLRTYLQRTGFKGWQIQPLLEISRKHGFTSTNKIFKILAQVDHDRRVLGLNEEQAMFRLYQSIVGIGDG